jgi:hypothetical protein
MQSILGKAACVIVLSFSTLLASAQSPAVCNIKQGCTGANNAAGALANLGGQPVSFTGTTDPPGQACAVSPAVNLGTYATSTTDKLYQCLAGTWTLVGGGGSGGGTVTSGSGYKIPAYGSAASTTVGPSNVTTDATGNNLNVPGTVAAGASITSPKFSMGPLSTIPSSWTFDVTTPGTALASLGGEPALGNPSTNGYVLSSTTTGTRSWIANAIGSAAWGAITGTLSSQTDLQNALNAKAALAGAAFTGSVTAPNVTDSALTPGNCVQAGTVGLLSTVSIPCYNLGGSVPTITLGAGAGTGGSFVEGGSDGSHNIFITVGSAPAANSLLWSATFTAPRSTYAYCIVSPNFIYAQPYLSLTQVPGVVANNVLTTGYTVNSGSVALTAGGIYAFEVSCP